MSSRRILPVRWKHSGGSRKPPARWDATTSTTPDVQDLRSGAVPASLHPPRQETDDPGLLTCRKPRGPAMGGHHAANSRLAEPKRRAMGAARVLRDARRDDVHRSTAA